MAFFQKDETVNQEFNTEHTIKKDEIQVQEQKEEAVAGEVTLESFLAPNIEQAGEVTREISKRFPPFTLRPISEAQAAEIRKRNTKTVKKPKKGSGYMQQIDGEKNILEMVIASTVMPDFNDAKIQASWGVIGAGALVQKMLLPGEYTRLCEYVTELNDFDAEIDEEIEEAKN